MDVPLLETYRDDFVISGYFIWSLTQSVSKAPTNSNLTSFVSQQPFESLYQLINSFVCDQTTYENEIQNLQE
jgi:hypothetical protein